MKQRAKPFQRSGPCIGAGRFNGALRFTLARFADKLQLAPEPTLARLVPGDLTRAGFRYGFRPDVNKQIRPNSKGLLELAVEKIGIGQAPVASEFGDHHDLLAAFMIQGEGRDAALADRGILLDNHFDVLRIVVEPSNNDEILRPPANIELTVVQKA